MATKRKNKTARPLVVGQRVIITNNKSREHLIAGGMRPGGVIYKIDPLFKMGEHLRPYLVILDDLANIGPGSPVTSSYAEHEIFPAVGLWQMERSRSIPYHPGEPLPPIVACDNHMPQLEASARGMGMKVDSVKGVSFGRCTYDGCTVEVRDPNEQHQQEGL